MIQLTGYQIIELIHESNNSQVYRGMRQGDKLPVILKLLQGEYPTPSRLTTYRQEFDITRNFEGAGVVRVYDLVKYRNSLVMVLEDFGGQSLNLLQLAGRLSLAEFLQLAIQLSELVGQVHQARVIHKDINLANIVLNPVTNVVKLIDFGISTRLSREHATFRNPNHLEGTLAYISPEQTGRMNRVIDYRTDLYSLGVSLYELLTGKLPFEESDPMALVHAHMARQPVPPHEVASKENGVDYSILSDIIMKLLAKNAEDRYQSAFGLKWDLEQTLTLTLSPWEREQNNPTLLLPPFGGKEEGLGVRVQLGQRDFSGRFQIPQKLYGREQEIEILLNAFERVSQGESKSLDLSLDSNSELLLIAGYSGVGKSALVHEIHKPITARQGYFVSGKYDQYQRNVPYYALTQALNEFCNQLLTELPATLAEWKRRILATVGHNGQVLIEVIPNLEWLIGAQPPVPEVGPKESQNRFNMLFQNFIKVISQPEHPLVMFIDDLQWADMASLELLKALLTDSQNQYLLIIGAYRDNEVDNRHPFMVTVAELQQAGAMVTSISLPNLTKQDVLALVADTLQSDAETVRELVELLYEKTQGNAFFVTQFLTMLHEQGLLEFNYTSQMSAGWRWNVPQIRALNLSDNVVELMAGKLARLEVATQTMLKLAACVGNKFALSTLAIISEQTPYQTLSVLWVAIEEGLILPLDEIYRQIMLSNLAVLQEQSDIILSDCQFKFLHDRVQQAAYSLIAEDDRAALHLKIGRLWLADTLPADSVGTKWGLEERLFDIVNHLNLGQALIETAAEKLQLAELNLQAGQKAKSSSAYTAAVKLFHIGLDLLPENSWEAHYDLTFALYRACAEGEYLAGQGQEADKLYPIMLAHSQSMLDKVTVYTIQSHQYRVEGRIAESLQTEITALSLLGVNIPETMEGQAELAQAELTHVEQLFTGRNVMELLHAPVLTTPALVATLELLSGLATTGFILNKIPLLKFAGAKMTAISVEHGNSYLASFCYVTHAMVCVGILKQYELGYQLGELSVALAYQFNDLVMQARVNLMYGNFVQTWFTHQKESMIYYQRSIQAGLAGGELEYGNYSIAYLIQTFINIGTPLDQFYDLAKEYKSLVQQTNPYWYEITYEPTVWQMLLNLLGQTHHWGTLDSDTFSEAAFLAKHQPPARGYVWLSYAKIISLYRFGFYEEAKSWLDKVEVVISFLGIRAASAEYAFYVALLSCALYEKATETEQKRYMGLIEGQLARFEGWTTNCEANFLHKQRLIQAEKARILGQKSEAIDFYDEAIALAKRAEYINNEALANELAAKFWLNWGKPHVARHYLREAHYGYQRWGATAKVQQLEEQYPEIRLQVHQHFSRQGTVAATHNSSQHNNSGSQMLDLASVMKAAQTISGEIELNRLLEKMMRIVLENAGAQRGLLILRQNNQWLLQAEADEHQVTVMQVIPADGIGGKSNNPKVSLSMLRYVERLRTPLVLDDATQAKQFAQTVYVRKYQPKSVLCLPLINQQRVTAFIYLENNLIIGAFTPQRLEILNLLSSQIAISIENAKLYQEATKLSALQRELGIAREMQESLLPPPKPDWPGLEVVCYSLSAKEVGGDFYKYHLTPDKYIFAIGDVSGKGVSASLLMATSLSQFDASLALDLGAVERMVYLDTVISLYTKPKKQNCAMCYVEIGVGSKKDTSSLLPTPYSLTVINAGCIPPYIRRAGGTMESLELGGFALGQGLGAESDYEMLTAAIGAGDMLILTSDGVVEANNKAGEMLGFDRLEAIIQQGPTTRAEAMLEYLKQAIFDFTQEAEPHDDLTMMVVQLKN